MKIKLNPFDVSIELAAQIKEPTYLFFFCASISSFTVLIR